MNATEFYEKDNYWLQHRESAIKFAESYAEHKVEETQKLLRLLQDEFAKILDKNIAINVENESLKKQLEQLERENRANNGIISDSYNTQNIDLGALDKYLYKNYHIDLLDPYLQEIRLICNSELRKQIENVVRERDAYFDRLEELRKQIEELKEQCKSDYKENRVVREDIISANELIKELKAENKILNQMYKDAMNALHEEYRKYQ